MLVISMVAFTSCDSGTELTEESKTSTSRTELLPLEENVFDDLSAQAVYDKYNSTIGQYSNTTAKVNCMSIGSAIDAYGVTHPVVTACVTTGGSNFYVTYTPEYMTVGNTHVYESSSVSLGCSCR